MAESRQTLQSRVPSSNEPRGEDKGTGLRIVNFEAFFGDFNGPLCLHTSHPDVLKGFVPLLFNSLPKPATMAGGVNACAGGSTTAGGENCEPESRVHFVFWGF